MLDRMGLVKFPRGVSDLEIVEVKIYHLHRYSYLVVNNHEYK